MKAIVVIADPSPVDIGYNMDKRFLMDCHFIRRNLKNKLEFDADDIFCIFTGKLNNSAQRVRESLEAILLEYRDEDFCLFYTGHGQPEGWALSGIRDKEVLSYENLNLVLALHSGSLIFVNCCCYAGSAEKSLQARAGEFLLLAAMPSFISGPADNFFNRLFMDWSSRNYFNPTLARVDSLYSAVIFGNSDLERLVFPKKRR